MTPKQVPPTSGLLPLYFVWSDVLYLKWRAVFHMICCFKLNFVGASDSVKPVELIACQLLTTLTRYSCTVPHRPLKVNHAFTVSLPRDLPDSLTDNLIVRVSDVDLQQQQEAI